MNYQKIHMRGSNISAVMNEGKTIIVAYNYLRRLSQTIFGNYLSPSLPHILEHVWQLPQTIFDELFKGLRPGVNNFTHSTINHPGFTKGMGKSLLFIEWDGEEFIVSVIFIQEKFIPFSKKYSPPFYGIFNYSRLIKSLICFKLQNQLLIILDLSLSCVKIISGQNECNASML